MIRFKSYIEQHIRDSIAAKTAFIPTCCEVLPLMAEKIAGAFAAGGRLFLFGNGGSAADAQHIAAEFVNRLRRERRALAAIALTTDSSILTSIANDYEFDEIFARQLSALGRQGDVALGISTSGRSPNVLKALKLARENGIETLGFAGNPGAEMDGLCDYILHVQSSVTAIIQECHITAGHILCALSEEVLLVSEK